MSIQETRAALEAALTSFNQSEPALRAVSENSDEAYTLYAGHLQGTNDLEMQTRIANMATVNERVQHLVGRQLLACSLVASYSQHFAVEAEAPPEPAVPRPRSEEPAMSHPAVFGRPRAQQSHHLQQVPPLVDTTNERHPTITREAPNGDLRLEVKDGFIIGNVTDGKVKIGLLGVKADPETGKPKPENTGKADYLAGRFLDEASRRGGQILETRVVNPNVMKHLIRKFGAENIIMDNSVDSCQQPGHETRLMGSTRRGPNDVSIDLSSPAVRRRINRRRR